MLKPILSGMSVLRKPIEMRQLPTSLQIEVTNQCNLNCRMCFRTHYVNAPGYMSLVDFQRMIDLVRPQNISIAGQGEPMLNHDLPAMVKYAKHRRASVNISSNLTAFTSDRANELVKSGLDLLQISIDAVSKETYLKIRGQDYFEKIIDAIGCLADAKKKLHSIRPFTRLRMVLQRENYEEASDLISLAARHGVDEVFFIPIVLFPEMIMNRAVDREALIGGMNADGLLKELERARKAANKFRIVTNLNPLLRDFDSYWNHYYASETKRVDTKTCLLPWISMYVHLDGTVKACPFFYAFENHALGNILTDGIQNVWNGEHFQRLRAGLRNGGRPCKLCEACVPYSFFFFNKLSNILPGLFNLNLKLGMPFGKTRL